MRVKNQHCLPHGLTGHSTTGRSIAAHVHKRRGLVAPIRHPVRTRKHTNTHKASLRCVQCLALALLQLRQMSARKGLGSKCPHASASRASACRTAAPTTGAMPSDVATAVTALTLHSKAQNRDTGDDVVLTRGQSRLLVHCSHNQTTQPDTPRVLARSESGATYGARPPDKYPAATVTTPTHSTASTGHTLAKCRPRLPSA